MPARFRKRIVVVAALVAVAAAAVFTTVSPASGHHVTIKGSSLVTYHFMPKSLHVQRGATVHWSWSSNAPHNVTFKSISAHSATGASETFSHKFKKAGTYRYICTIHDFKGKVVVG